MLLTTEMNGTGRAGVPPLQRARSVLLGLTVGLRVVTQSAAGADGMHLPAPVTYVCRGGVRVQVTPMGDTAIVNFAGNTTTLSLLPGGSFGNAQVTWVTQDGTSTLRNNATGRLQLSGCRPLH
ncbi:hypothetical protein [Deinococcus sp.]|uniref:hypothetical protein n=1 Tax=Deinococcus sp. TaxID=47478 RepID=UPI002869CCB9|nr:hypothetical protein [Deinococcus sp.]